ncbi:hypothetical protein ALO45_200232 [Pseudomonas syringae pv. syringae]|nr:hypothetical protein ALO45_200232 [Pseudomonas syringae pv. syringae]
MVAGGAVSDVLASRHEKKVMGVLDEINTRWGRETLRAGSVPADREWATRCELMSQSYTTRLDQLWGGGVFSSSVRVRIKARMHLDYWDSISFEDTVELNG